VSFVFSGVCLLLGSVTVIIYFGCLFVSTSASDCLERFVFEMTCYVSSGT